MSNKNRKKPKKQKSEIDLKSWLLGAITDLIIGIILLILDKLLSQLERGESPSLKQNITRKLICVKDVVETRYILYCNWSCKACLCTHKEREG